MWRSVGRVGESPWSRFVRASVLVVWAGASQIFGLFSSFSPSPLTLFFSGGRSCCCSTSIIISSSRTLLASAGVMVLNALIYRLHAPVLGILSQSPASLPTPLPIHVDFWNYDSIYNMGMLDHTLRSLSLPPPGGDQSAMSIPARPSARQFMGWVSPPKMVCSHARPISGTRV